MSSMLETIRNERIAKVLELRKRNQDPYPAKTKRTNKNIEIKDNFEKLENTEVSVLGRIMAWRDIGKLIFVTLRDESADLQIFVRVESLKESDKACDLKMFDIGDFIEVTGTVLKTKSGEISVGASKMKIISKAIRPLPEKWKGIVDADTKFRRRYLDMVMNPDVRDRFKRRSQFWQATRDFMNERGFVEINIPVLEHLTGGADAKPFVTHFDALGEDFYLRISHELPLKRLLGGGFEKVYDIGVRFRNEGYDDEHLPEHIAMEFYWAFANYEDGMEFTEDMFRYILNSVYGTLQFKVRGFDIDLEPKWEVKKFEDLLIERYPGIDIYNDSESSLNTRLQKIGIDLGDDVNRSRIVDHLWKNIRKDIGGPIFVVGIPKFFSPLSKTDQIDGRVVERFFPVIGGSELANAFSELNDPIDQLERFVEQQKMRDAGDEEAQMLDIDFVEMLEYGMPPAFGFGMSERVFWFFEGVTAREGVPFPQLKSEYDPLTLEIYSEIRQYFEKKHSKTKK
jgi:lysyl-tRNA synthetase, class II